jgi:preprotein translocase subunit SecD
VRNVGNDGTWGTTKGKNARAFLTSLTFLTVSCSTEKAEPAANWSRVPVAIELRLAQAAAGPGLEARKVYGQGRTVYLHPQVELSNSDIARVEALQTRIGKGVILQVWHTKAGARRMAELTSKHIGDSLAILINSVVVSVPRIQDTINPGTTSSSDIGVPLEPKEAGQLARAVSQTWPARARR